MPEQHLSSNEKSFDNFSLNVVVIPGRAPSRENLHLYNEIYNTWQLVWKQTFLEVDGSDELYSDHFTRQDYIVAIMHGSRCAALTCFRRAELSTPAHQLDSWFKPWPKTLLSRLAEQNLQGLVVSWVTIHHEYRKSTTDLSLRELDVSSRLGEMLNLFLDDSSAPIAFGATRNNRSVNKFCARAGSLTLHKGVIVHGIDTDLIAWYPSSIKAAQAEFAPIALQLWSGRMVYQDRQLSISQPTRPVPRVEPELNLQYT